MFSDLISSISDFTNEISSVTDSNGVPIAAIKSAADNLNSKLEQLLNIHLDPDNSKTFIASNQVFISVRDSILYTSVLPSNGANLLGSKLLLKSNVPRCLDIKILFLFLHYFL
jgi:hypothetical protein